ncbi:hypothetical protein ABW636_21330 [Aquimarina sp. 2201CG1-2-11]
MKTKGVIKLEKIQITKLNNTQLRIVQGGDNHKLKPKSKVTGDKDK